MALRKFSADVLWWDSSDVHVQCPFCGNIHRHRFIQGYDSIRRPSRCNMGPHFRFYSFKYPFSQSPEWTAYEIDKVGKRYVALGASPSEPEQDLLVGPFAGMKFDQKPTIPSPSWEDATETIIIGDNDAHSRQPRQVTGGDPTIELKRIEHVKSRMIQFGDVDYVREYLDSSLEKDLFIHGVDKEGKTALLLAAREKYPAVVKMLLERGADPNYQSKEGRTPLMEAALWGRYENVDHLLENGADKHLIDNDGLKAIDLATQSDRNEEERYRRPGGEYHVDEEVPYIANQARRMIVSILKDDVVDDQSPPAANAITGDQFLFQKSPSNIPSKITVYAPIAEYEISTPYKTIARLERGGRYPSIAAMSGWKHDGTTTLVSGGKWTLEVIRIADIIGHVLDPDDSKENRIPGLYLGCHAEKQLVAYFISKHVFLEPETRAPKEASAHPGTYYRGTDESEEGGTLYELAAKAPPVSLKKANIHVSSPPCGDCLRFIQLVNQMLDLTISVWSPRASD